MKSVKFLIFAMLGFTLGFTSCESLNLNPSNDDDSAYADFMFFATVDSSGGHGHRKNITEIEVSALPSAVTTYITTNYAGATIDRAGKSELGKFVVKITLSDGTSRGLLFAADGSFISENKGKGGKGPKGEKIDVSALPTAISSYISANYADATIHAAFKGSEGNYGVVIVNADETKTMLTFDANLAFTGEMDVKKRGGGRGKRGGK